MSDHVGPLRIRWLGQAGFGLTAGSTRLLVDVFGSNHELRLYPPRNDLDFLGAAQFILASHQHEDHLDLPFITSLLEHSPELVVVVPSGLADLVSSACPGARVLGLRIGEHTECGGAVVHAVPARHAVVMSDGYADSTPESGLWAGYVIELGGLVTYHAGDTLSSPTIIDAVRRFAVDVALLPVNGRDDKREADGIVGNMSAADAVELAARIGARVLVPMHHDAIRGNTAAAGEAADVVAQRGLPISVLNLVRDSDYDMAPQRRRSP
jgi:L-ascorbate metabolism protein UlaG (beta-lactamase superfamily)